MSFGINNLKAELVLDGARPTLFKVQITNPIENRDDNKVPFMVKAASLPASTLGKIEVPYMGRKIPYAGDRTFEDWTVTVINDEDFKVRNALEAWSNAMNSHQSNSREYARNYKSSANIIQLGKDGREIRTYTFNGIFPINISPIETAWETTDQIEEFQVTFAYDSWVIGNSFTGNSTY